jgi:hypothetical protein
MRLTSLLLLALITAWASHSPTVEAAPSGPPQPRTAEFAMRWDPEEGGPKTPEDVFALFGVPSQPPSAYEVRYFELPPSHSGPESTAVILRERTSRDSNTQILLKYRRSEPWPAAWACPAHAQYHRSEQLDITVLGGQRLQRVYSYSCSLEATDPPAPLGAKAKPCSSLMARYESPRIRVERWVLPGGRIMLEVSHAAPNTDEQLASFQRLAAQLIEAGAHPAALSKTDLGSRCP